MRLVCALFAAALGLPARADLGDQLFKLLPSDGVTRGDFGATVAIYGDTAIIGLHNSDDDTPRTTLAYLFDVTTGQQLALLTPDDGVRTSMFGSSVALNEQIAIVGVPLTSDNGENSGAAYVFDVGTGEQIAKLLPDDGAAHSWFGTDVAIGDGVVLIGAFADSGNGTGSGSAYLFDIGTGEQIGKLFAEDGEDNDEFGGAVALNGQIAYIGTRRDDDLGTTSGSVYVFDIGTGEQIGKLLADDGDEFSGFGNDVAVSGNIIVVGSDSDDDRGTSTGSAYVFDATTQNQLFKLMPFDAAQQEQFGFAVAIEGRIALISARRDTQNGHRAGAAYLFDVTTGAQVDKFVPDDGAEGDQFGAAAAMHAGIAVLGAPSDDDLGVSSGSAYVFDVRLRPNYIDTHACPGDIDGDGDTDAEDYFAFLDLFVAGDDRADIDGSGVIDADDYFAFLDLFAEGCP